MPQEGRLNIMTGPTLEVATKLNGAATEVEGELNDLDKTVKQFLNYENWTGPAKDEYDAQQDIWNKAARSMHSVLGMSGPTLNNMVDNIEVTEDINRRSMVNVY